MKNIIIAVVVIIIVGVGAYFLFWSAPDGIVDMVGDIKTADTMPDANQLQDDTQVGEDGSEKDARTESVIGKSVEGRDITAYHYGNGETEILFIGGTHGGYSWNTALVAYEAMDYLKANPGVIPDNVKVTVMPVLNPDGLNKVVGTAGRFTKADVSQTESVRTSGRFNANNVDLNRNFDCDWKKNAVWQDASVSGGGSAFSEPESKAVRDYVVSYNPDAVIVWYSAVGGVFSSNCHNGVLDKTNELTNIFAEASGYPAYEEFNFYEITGDMVNWLAKKGIPGISVLLTTHEDTEWSKNLAGIEALLSHYAK